MSRGLTNIKKEIEKTNSQNKSRNKSQGARGSIYSKRRTDVKTQFRKHRQQMTQEEVMQCASVVSGITRLKRHKHLISKNIRINLDHIYLTLGNKNLPKYIIEYNEKYDTDMNRWTQRVLFKIPILVKFRDNRNKEREGYLSAVVDITTKEVITAFYNLKEDKHNTLDLSYYTKELRVRPAKSGGYMRANLGLGENIRNKFNIE